MLKDLDPSTEPAYFAETLLGFSGAGKAERAHTQVIGRLLGADRKTRLTHEVLRSLLDELFRTDKSYVRPTEDLLERTEIKIEPLHRHPPPDGARLFPDLTIRVPGSKHHPALDVIIENKIKAEDGPEQMDSYRKLIERWSEQAEVETISRLVYLTPDKKKPAHSTHEAYLLSYRRLAVIWRAILAGADSRNETHTLEVTMLRLYLASVVQDVLKLRITMPPMPPTPLGHGKKALWVDYLKNAKRGAQ